MRHIPAHATQYDIALKMAPFERDRHHSPRRTRGRIIYRTEDSYKYATEPEKLMGSLSGTAFKEYLYTGNLVGTRDRSLQKPAPPAELECCPERPEGPSDQML